MLNVSDEIKQAYNDSTTQLDKIILNNNEYIITNVEYYDDTYENGNIFGTAIARCLDFEIENNINLEKQEVEYQTGIKINGITQWISIGNFIIQDVEPNDTTNIAKVSAMDYMLKTNTPYQSNLKYENGTVRILDVLLEVCNNTGLELATTNFTNKDFIVDSNQFSEGTLNRQVIQAVAQISGTFAKIKNDNKLYLITPIRKTLYVKEVHKMLVSELNSLPIEKLSECDNKYSLDSYKELILKRNTHPINLVCLGMSDIEGENTVLRDENSIKKDGENSLIINNNPFAYKQKKREQLITALFETVKGFSYTSFEIKGQAKPYLETGDEVAVIDKKGNVSSSFLFRFNYKSPNGLESEMSAPSIIKATVEYQNIPDALEIAKRTEYMVDKQNQKIESLVSQLGDRTEKETSVTQDIDSITSRVHKLEEFTRTITETNQIHLNETAKGQGYILEFKIKGNTEYFKYLVPSDNLVPSNTLVPLGGHFTLVCDKQSRTSKSNEAVEIDVVLDNPLRNVGDIYDELNIIDSKTTVTRRIGVNNDGSLYVLDKAVTETLQNVKLTTFDSNTYVYIKEYSGLEYTAKYIVKNDYSDKFITKLEADTKIEQKADSIELGVNKKLESYSTTEEINSAIQLKADSITSIVSKKVGDDELCSKISQSADKISLIGNRINIISDKFKLTDTGEISVVDGSFKVIDNTDKKLMDFSKSGIRFYSDNGYEIGGLVSTQQDNGKLFLTLTDGTSLNISKTSDDGTFFYSMLTFDDVNNVPFIRNTANGTLFKEAGGGIKVDNGLITDWNLQLNSFELSNVTIVGIKVVDGLVMSVTYQQN